MAGMMSPIDIPTAIGRAVRSGIHSIEQHFRKARIERHFHEFLATWFFLSRQMACDKERHLVFPIPMMDITRLLATGIKKVSIDRDGEAVNLRAEGYLDKNDVIYIPRNVTRLGDVHYVMAHEFSHRLREVRGRPPKQPARFVSPDHVLRYFRDVENHEPATDKLAYELMMPDFLFRAVAGHNGPVQLANYFTLDPFHLFMRLLHLCERNLELIIFHRDVDNPGLIFWKDSRFEHGEGVEYTFRLPIEGQPKRTLSEPRSTTTHVMLDKFNDERQHLLLIGDLISELERFDRMGIRQVVAAMQADPASFAEPFEACRAMPFRAAGVEGPNDYGLLWFVPHTAAACDSSNSKNGANPEPVKLVYVLIIHNLTAEEVALSPAPLYPPWHVPGYVFEQKLFPHSLGIPNEITALRKANSPHRLRIPCQLIAPGSDFTFRKVNSWLNQLREKLTLGPKSYGFGVTLYLTPTGPRNLRFDDEKYHLNYDYRWISKNDVPIGTPFPDATASFSETGVGCFNYIDPRFNPPEGLHYLSSRH